MRKTRTRKRGFYFRGIYGNKIGFLRQMNLPQLCRKHVLVLVSLTSAITESEIVDFLGTLSSDERAQYEKFIGPLNKLQFAVTRALLRKVLANYLGCDAHKVAFTKNYFGKLGLENGCDLQFNVSHCDGCCVVALTRQARVGVDVESVAVKRPRYVDIAKRYFSLSEFEFLLSVPNKRRYEYFVELWTLKEAYVKAIGVGLSKPLEECCFFLCDDGHLRFKDTALNINNISYKWGFFTYCLENDYRLAIAVAKDVNPIDVIVLRSFPEQDGKRKWISPIRNAVTVGHPNAAGVCP